tara:strand:- start:1801 stop:2244 length:444 start_codon:yes stop_codon:yes gene_type:complete
MAINPDRRKDFTMMGESSPEKGTGDMESMIIDGMLADESPVAAAMDGSIYSQMSDKEKMPFQQKAFEYFGGLYKERDMDKFGRLNFKDFVGGMTPEEGFITELGNMDPADEAQTMGVIWNETFGEDTAEMKEAAVQYLMENVDSITY